MEEVNPENSSKLVESNDLETNEIIDNFTHKINV